MPNRRVDLNVTPFASLNTIPPIRCPGKAGVKITLTVQLVADAYVFGAQVPAFAAYANSRAGEPRVSIWIPPTVVFAGIEKVSV
jgi:hypothetical protein